ncbi:MAG: fimbria/pilus outer membrane usher protein [Novosphingobium sp.]|nr:fimbria/pilus outer membrane usher protein [Novosphingobium sp.]
MFAGRASCLAIGLSLFLAGHATRADAAAGAADAAVGYGAEAGAGASAGAGAVFPDSRPQPPPPRRPEPAEPPAAVPAAADPAAPPAPQPDAAHEADKPSDVAALTPYGIANLLASDRIGRSSGAEDRPTSPGAVAAELLLQAVVNGTRTDSLIFVEVHQDGSLSATAQSLRDIRILIDPTVPDDAKVPLASLAGVSAQYDAQDQSLALSVPDAMLKTFRVDVQPPVPAPDFAAIHSSPGVVLNYGVYGYTYQGRTQFSGDVDLVLMSKYGVFSTTGVWHTGGGTPAFVRLASTWRLVDPVHIRSYTAGDFVSNAIYGASSVRLGGIQFASAFDQRPDLVITPLPQFAGSAALPSTVDLYLNDRRLISTQVPSGPFDLIGSRISSGGAYRMVTTDMAGRVIEINRNFYYAPGQLARGVLQFSIDLGAPRRNFGIRSFDYDNTLFASGSFRYGLTNTTTVQGNVEAAADGLVTVGGGILQAIGGRLALTATASGSHYDGQTGWRLSARAQTRIGSDITLYASTQRTSDDYVDLARLASLREWKRSGIVTGDPWMVTSTYARAIDSGGISYRPWFDRMSSIGFSYSRMVARDSSARTASLTYHRRLTSRIDLTANGYRSWRDTAAYGRERETAGFLNLNIRLGGNLQGFVGVDARQGETSYTTQLSNSPDSARQGAFSWQVSRRQVIESGAAQYSAAASYLLPQMAVAGGISVANGTVYASAQAQGSLVLMDGRLFAANRVGDAFAVIEGAGPHVDVLRDGGVIARTNGNGDAFLPNLTPYTRHRITVDPTNLPDDWSLPETELTATAAYRQGTIVRFAAAPSYSALLILHDAKGVPLPMGRIVTIDNGQTGSVARDGEAYVMGLKPHNSLTVDLGADGTCSASFDYDPKGPPQPRIGPIICR